MWATLDCGLELSTRAATSKSFSNLEIVYQLLLSLIRLKRLHGPDLLRKPRALDFSENDLHGSRRIKLIHTTLHLGLLGVP